MYYTYLIYCKPTNQFYYGVSYRRDANPGRLWKTYFTSSKLVHALIEEHGKEAFECEIRKTFTDITKARLWEEKVLRRMKVVKDPKWLNQTDMRSFAPIYGDKNHSKLPKVKAKLKASLEQMALEAGYSSYKEWVSINNPAKDPAVASKIGKWKSDRIWITDIHGQNRMILPSELEMYEQNGFVRGKSNANLVGKNVGKKYIHLGEKVKSVPAEQLDSYLQMGWILGRPKPCAYLGDERPHAVENPLQED